MAGHFSTPPGLLVDRLRFPGSAQVGSKGQVRRGITCDRDSKNGVTRKSRKRKIKRMGVFYFLQSVCQRYVVKSRKRKRKELLLLLFFFSYECVLGIKCSKEVIG